MGNYLPYGRLTTIHMNGLRALRRKAVTKTGLFRVGVDGNGTTSEVFSNGPDGNEVSHTQSTSSYTLGTNTTSPLSNAAAQAASIFDNIPSYLPAPVANWFSPNATAATSSSQTPGQASSASTPGSASPSGQAQENVGPGTAPYVAPPKTSPSRPPSPSPKPPSPWWPPTKLQMAGIGAGVAGLGTAIWLAVKGKK